MPIHLVRRAAAVCFILPVTLAAQATWRLQETLRIGGADTGVTEFQWIKSIDVDARGRVHVYNHRTQEIRVFARDGQYQGTIGRLGSGPGEMRNAEGFVILRDGRIWIRDAANGRFMVLDAQGKHQSTWNATFCSSQQSWTPLLDAKGRIVDTDCAIRNGDRREEMLLAIRTDGSQRIDTLGVLGECASRRPYPGAWWIAQAGRSMNYLEIPFAARPHGIVDEEGAFWCATPTTSYAIWRARLGATDTLRISRSVVPVPVTSFERDSIIKRIEANGPTGLDFSRLPNKKQVIERLTIDDKGQLWVRRTNANSEIAFDVWDKRGKQVATVTLGAVRLSGYSPFVVRGNEIYSVIFDSDDVEYLVRYRIVK